MICLHLNDHFSIATNAMRPFSRIYGFCVCFVPLHPQLSQVKSQGQKKQFGADIGFSTRQKAAKAEVGFQQGEGALHLNRAAKAQVDTSFRCNIRGCLVSLLPKCFLEHNFLGLIRILGSAALDSMGTAGASFTPIPGGGHKLFSLYFCRFPHQGQLSALGAGEAVLIRAVFHVFNAAHLFLKFLCPLLIVVCGLD